MPKYSKKDITTFQKLYKKHYYKIINPKEAEIKIDALVDLIRLAIESKISQNNKEQ